MWNYILGEVHVPLRAIINYRRNVTISWRNLKCIRIAQHIELSGLVKD